MQKCEKTFALRERSETECCYGFERGACELLCRERQHPAFKAAVALYAFGVNVTAEIARQLLDTWMEAEQ